MKPLPSNADATDRKPSSGVDALETPRVSVKFIVLVAAFGGLVLVTATVTLFCLLLVPSGSSRDPTHPSLSDGSPGGPSPGSSKDGREDEQDFPSPPPGRQPDDVPRREEGSSTHAGPPPAVIVMKRTTPPPTTPNQMYFIPHEDLHVMMHGPSGAHGGFTPLYDEAPKRRFCTVIAGTETLGITGGGTNGAMADLLVRLSKGAHGRSQVEAFTQEAHGDIVKRARAAPGKFVTLPTTSCPFYDRVFSFYEAHAGKSVEETVAVPILVILRRDYRIHGHQNNDCLLYVVSPKGYAPDPDFEYAYRATYRNLLSVVHRFNKQMPIGPLMIQQLRIPLLSGGIYRHHRSAADLAYIAADTMLQWMWDEKPDFTLDLAYDTSNSFFYGFRRAAFG